MLNFVSNYQPMWAIVGTCWISGDNNPLRIAFFFGPLFLYLVYALWLLKKVIERRHMLANGRNASFLRMIAFVVVFIAIWIWPMTFRVFSVTFSLWSSGYLFSKLSELITHTHTHTQLQFFEVTPAFFLTMHRMCISSQVFIRGDWISSLIHSFFISIMARTIIGLSKLFCMDHNSIILWHLETLPLYVSEKPRRNRWYMD